MTTEILDTDTDDEQPSFRIDHTITLRKTGKRALNDDKIAEQIAYLIARIQTPSRVAKGWRVTAGERAIEITNTDVVRKWKYRAPAGHKVYTVDLTVMYAGKVRGAAQVNAEFRSMVTVLVAASNRYPLWEVAAVDDQEWSDEEATRIKASGDDDYVGYAACELPGNWQQYFNHIYDREPQIRWLMTSLVAAADADWNDHRFNAILAGPPACGKSEVLSTLRKMLGNDAVLMLDGTAITQAGLTKELTEREELPRVIVVEEIEKGQEDVLRVLLGMMDTRGEIRKMTAREKIHRDARVIVMGTCNNYDKLSTMLEGALGSRFGEPIWFPRPDRGLMHKILKREIDKVNGSYKWIEPVLDYCDKRNIHDPRIAISFCMRGRDGWLDGSTERDLESIRKIGTEVSK